MFIVVYREHGQMQCETHHIGPFATHDEAYEYLGMLPALGICEGVKNTGCKYIQNLTPPDMEIANDILKAAIKF